LVKVGLMVKVKLEVGVIVGVFVLVGETVGVQVPPPGGKPD